MLRREVDFVPVTPKKSHGSGVGIEPLRLPSTPNSPFKNFRAIPDDVSSDTRHYSEQAALGGELARDVTKTTEQKKEFLGFMLGNVDALVDGVKRAGIWGLA
jgi:hypothetical protein